jgi:predicted TPR repeat methyltransferase
MTAMQVPAKRPAARGAVVHTSPKAGAETLPRALAAAIDALRAERLEQAETRLEHILRRWPAQADALHFLGVLRHAQGRAAEAVRLIRRSLAIQPGNASAWNNLGNVLLLEGQADEAAAAYECAIARGASEDVVRAQGNLGLLYRRLGRLDASERVLREALERDAQNGDAWYHLSTTLIKQGRIHDGLVAHSRAVALWPQQLQSRQEVIRALLLLDERERAARLLREWLGSEPGNAVAEHMLAACEGRAPARASDGYVQQVFDGFAASFDAKLEALHYRAPELVVQALRRAVGEPAASLSICDAGCGTGLCGPGLKPFASRLAGCDLSEGMLRRAQARQVYDVLHRAELTHYLSTQPGAFDAVVSADTLCYFGALEAVLDAVRTSLRPGGRLVFTVEALAEDHAMGHRLQGNGRYAHHESYLAAVMAASGFDAVEAVSVVLRLEAGEPVNGWLIGASTPGGERQ